jgi:hypothetical protein
MNNINSEESFKNIQKWNQSSTDYLILDVDSDGRKLINKRTFSFLDRCVDRIQSIFGYGSFQKVCAIFPQVINQAHEETATKNEIMWRLNQKIDRYNSKWFRPSWLRILEIHRLSIPIPQPQHEASQPFHSPSSLEAPIEEIFVSVDVSKDYYELRNNLTEKAQANEHQYYDPFTNEPPLIGIIGAPVDVMRRDIFTLTQKDQDHAIDMAIETEIEKSSIQTQEEKRDIREKVTEDLQRRFTAEKTKETLEKEVLEKLGSHFDACSVKGDGSCMFRAFAFSLLHRYLNDIELLDTRVKGMYETYGLKHLECTEQVEKDLNEAKKYVDYSFWLLRENIPLELVLRNELISNSWVHLLRVFVTKEKAEKAQTEEGYFQLLGEELEDFSSVPAASITEENERMIKKESKVFGGGADLLALSQLFRIPITVIQYDEFKKSRSLRGTTLCQQKETHSSINKGIFLLRKGGGESDAHYDILFPKNTEMSQAPTK